MNPQLESWTPLSCQEVYEAIANFDNGKDEKSTDPDFEKSLVWYFKAFEIVKEATFEEVAPLIRTLYTKYDFSLQEVIQILDIRPKKLVDLHCILPNCSKRFSERDRLS